MQAHTNLIRRLRKGLLLTQAEVVVELPETGSVPIVKRTFEKCETPGEDVSMTTLIFLFDRFKYFANKLKDELAQLERQGPREGNPLWENRATVISTIAEVQALQSWRDLLDPDAEQPSRKTDWASGLWTGSEIQESRDWKADFLGTLSLTLEPTTKEVSYRGNYKIEVKDFTPKTELEGLESKVRSAATDTFTVRGKIRQDKFLCLEYSGSARARRFGTMLLQLTNSGNTLVGFVLGFSGVEDDACMNPVIGTSGVTLNFQGTQVSEREQ